MRDFAIGGEAISRVPGGIPSCIFAASNDHLAVLSLVEVSWPGNCTKTYNDAVWDFSIRHITYSLLPVVIFHRQRVWRV